MKIIVALSVAMAAIPTWADSHVPPASAQTGSYQSVFAGYQPFQDEPVRDWRQANDDMGRLRGHMGHLESSVSPTDGTDDQANATAGQAPDERR
jgi:hypothetical protein